MRWRPALLCSQKRLHLDRRGAGIRPAPEFWLPPLRNHGGREGKPRLLANYAVTGSDTVLTVAMMRETIW